MKDWTADTPNKTGFYWCHQNSTRMVKVWSYDGEVSLFTNEDGGASVYDEIYRGVMWFGPIIEPPYPSVKENK